MLRALLMHGVRDGPRVTSAQRPLHSAGQHLLWSQEPSYMPRARQLSGTCARWRSISQNKCTRMPPGDRCGRAGHRRAAKQDLYDTERLLDWVWPCLVDQNPIVDAVLMDPSGSAEASRARANDDDPNLRTAYE